MGATSILKIVLFIYLFNLKLAVFWTRLKDPLSDKFLLPEKPAGVPFQFWRGMILCVNLMLDNIRKPSDSWYSFWFRHLLAYNWDTIVLSLFYKSTNSQTSNIIYLISSDSVVWITSILWKIEWNPMLMAISFLITILSRSLSSDTLQCEVKKVWALRLYIIILYIILILPAQNAFFSLISQYKIQTKKHTKRHI